MPRLNPSSLPASRPATNRLVRTARIARLALHVLRGAFYALGVYPLVADATRRQLLQDWSRRLLAILGVELQAHGDPIAPGCLVVANHISWLDIFVLNALAPSAFVAKAEVRGWPLIGWLAAKNGTVFLRRGSRGHAKIINGEIAALLDAGRNVALFPEGTTSDGSGVLHFHAALLQPAIECGHPVQPVAISYHEPDGRFSRTPAYDGDISLGQSLAAILAAPRLVARTTTFAPLRTDAAIDRRTLARAARDAVISGIGRGNTGCTAITANGDAAAPGQPNRGS